MQNIDPDDLPEEVEEIITAITMTVNDMSEVGETDINIILLEDSDIGIAHVTTDSGEQVARFAFTTDSSRQMWLMGGGDD